MKGKLYTVVSSESNGCSPGLVEPDEFCVMLHPVWNEHVQQEGGPYCIHYFENCAPVKIEPNRGDFSISQDSILLSQALIKKLKIPVVKESFINAQVSIQPMPLAQKIIVGNEMPGRDRVEVGSTTADPQDPGVLKSLRFLANRIRKHETLKLRQLLKQHVIRELHSENGPVPLAKINSSSEILFEFGHELYVDENGKYQSKDFFLKKSLIARPVHICLTTGLELLEKITVASRPAKDILHIVPEERSWWLVVTSSTHQDVQTGDIFFSINGEAVPQFSRDIINFRNEKLFDEVPDTVLATFLRPDKGSRVPNSLYPKVSKFMNGVSNDAKEVKVDEKFEEVDEKLAPAIARWNIEAWSDIKERTLEDEIEENQEFLAWRHANESDVETDKEMQKEMTSCQDLFKILTLFFGSQGFASDCSNALAKTIHSFIVVEKKNVIEVDAWPVDVIDSEDEDWPSYGADWPSDGEKGEADVKASELQTADSKPKLKDILSEHGFRTIETSREGNSFWETIAILLNPCCSLETLRKMGKVAGIREATSVKLRSRFDAGELSAFGITSEQIAMISKSESWTSNVHIAELARNLRLKVCVWMINDMQLQRSFTTDPYEAPEGEVQENAPETVLNVLLCNAKQPFAEIDRNHFQPLINSDDLAEGMGFSIVWGNFQEEGGDNDNASDAGTSEWENISVCSDVQSVCSLADFDDSMIHNKDVKIGLIVYRSKAAEVGILHKTEVKDGETVNSYNLPHGDFIGTNPLECAENIFEEIAWWEDRRSFAILERIIIVQEKESLILLFPAMCECDLRLINDFEQDLQWRNVASIVSSQDKTLPMSICAVVAKGAQLLHQFEDEMPPLLPRNMRESAELTMSVLKQNAQRLNKKGIKDVEIIEYLSKHPDDMAWMLGNLYDPLLDCKPLFTKIQRWLAWEKLGRMNDIKQMPSQYHLDVSENSVVSMADGTTDQMRMDHLLAMSLHDEEVARNLSNKDFSPNRSNPPPAKPAPVRSNRRDEWRRNASVPATEIELKCIETFKTRGHPNELIQQGWCVRVIQEQFDDLAHLILVDHAGLKCKQWLGGPDVVYFEGLEKLKQGYRYPVKNQKPKAPPRPLPNPPEKEPVKQEEKKKDPAKQVSDWSFSPKLSDPAKQEEMKDPTKDSGKGSPSEVVPDLKIDRTNESEAKEDSLSDDAIEIANEAKWEMV